MMFFSYLKIFRKNGIKQTVSVIITLYRIEVKLELIYIFIFFFLSYTITVQTLQSFLEFINFNNIFKKCTTIIKYSEGGIL